MSFIQLCINRISALVSAPIETLIKSDRGASLIRRRNFLLFVGGYVVLTNSKKADAAGLSVDHQTNWVTREAGAKVHSFSSEFGAGWIADNLIPSKEQLLQDGRPIHDLIWSSGSSVPFPHWVILDLGQKRWLTSFTFNNALSEEADHPGISSRKLELWVGDNVRDLKKVAAFELARNQNSQVIAIEPVEAQLIKFQITSNWGHPWYTELGASMASDDGRRPNDLNSVLRKNGRIDLYGIYFDFGSATLRPESEPVLGQILDFLKMNPKQKLVIEGHTDSVGSEVANSELSAKRAAAVVAELIRRGAPRLLLSAQGRGATQPVAPNTSDSGRARNRRVTVVLS